MRTPDSKPSAWRRKLAAGMTALAVVVGGSVASSGATASAAGNEIGVSTIVGKGGMCLDLPFQNTRNGTDLWIWGCNGTAAQSWTIRDSGEITVKGRCLDVQGPSRTDGTPAQIWQCVNVNQQKWRLTVGGEIRSVFSGDCLTIEGGRTNFRTPVTLRTCNGSSEQRWALNGLRDAEEVCNRNNTYVEEVRLSWNNKGLVTRMVPSDAARRDGEDAFDATWAEIRACIPNNVEKVLSFPDTPAVNSVKNQVKCHEKYTLRGLFGGPTWDYESYSNLGNGFGEWLRTRCNGTTLR